MILAFACINLQPDVRAVVMYSYIVCASTVNYKISHVHMLNVKTLNHEISWGTVYES